MVRSPAELVKALVARGLRTASGCLEWQGARGPHGYGRVKVGARVYAVPRLRWELEHGPLPRHLFVCHRCDNPPCFESAHLFCGTARDNYDDSLSKGRAYIPRQLSDEDVVLLRMLYTSRQFSAAFLAAGFGVSIRTVQTFGQGRGLRGRRLRGGVHV